MNTKSGSFVLGPVAVFSTSSASGANNSSSSSSSPPFFPLPSAAAASEAGISGHAANCSSTSSQVAGSPCRKPIVLYVLRSEWKNAVSSSHCAISGPSVRWAALYQDAWCA